MPDGERAVGIPSLQTAIADFLADLTHSNRSAHTRRVYAADLQQFAAFYRGSLPDITVDVLRAHFATWISLSPATRARKQAAIASFLAWAYRQDLIRMNPMGKIDRVKLDRPSPRGLERTRSKRYWPASHPLGVGIACCFACSTRPGYVSVRRSVSTSKMWI